MAVVIPGVPDNGGALAKYLTKIEGDIGWMPPAPPTITKELQVALNGDLNDPATWLAFGAQSLQTLWASLPDAARAEVNAKLAQLVSLGLQGINQASQAIGPAMSAVSDAIPLIGAIIDAVLIAVTGFIKLAKEQENDREDTAAGHYNDATRWTVEQYENPNSWVLQNSHVVNFLDRYDGDWRLRPSFSRSGGASNLMFSAIPGPPDIGGCGKGIWMKCGLKTFVTLADCHQNKDSDVPCDRRVMISALFYPFWSLSYPDQTSITEKARKGGGWGETGGLVNYVPVTANSILMARQVALLTSPSVNLRVNADRVVGIKDRFAYYFTNALKAFAEYKKNSFAGLPINKYDHTVERGQGTIFVDVDKAKELPGADEPNQFYFDGDGLIRAYSDGNLEAWGIPAKRGPQSPKDVAISFAQYNTVISGVLAFMSARANFLRSGPWMRQLSKGQDFNIKDYDKDVRAAMQYAIDYGKQIPAPILKYQVSLIPGSAIPSRPKRLGKKPKRAPKDSGLSGAPSRFSAGEKILAGAGVATAGYVIWKRKFRKK